jgi:hypothetical protein
MTSFASKADARAQVMLLAREGSRLDLYTDDGLHQEVVILPRRIDDQGFTVATLLPIPRDLPIWSAGETIRLRAAPFGAQLTLWCPLQDWVRVRDEWQLRLGWPGKWLDEERREALRIIVPTTHEAAWALLRTPDEPFLAGVHDLTRQGMGLRLKQRKAAVAEDLHELDIEIGRDACLIKCRLAICHRRIEQERQFLGGRFIDTDPIITQALHRLMLDLERGWLRHRSAGLKF